MMEMEGWPHRMAMWPSVSDKRRLTVDGTRKLPLLIAIISVAEQPGAGQGHTVHREIGTRTVRSEMGRLMKVALSALRVFFH